MGFTQKNCRNRKCLLLFPHFYQDARQNADKMIHLTITVSGGLNYTSSVSDCSRPLINQLAPGPSDPITRPQRRGAVASSQALAAGLLLASGCMGLLGWPGSATVFSLSLIKQHLCTAPYELELRASAGRQRVFIHPAGGHCITSKSHEWKKEVHKPQLMAKTFFAPLL